MISPIEDEETITRRMQGVRERGHLDAYELKVGVNRLGDWREHVRAHPFPAVIASAVVCFAVTRSLTKPSAPKHKTNVKSRAEEERDDAVAKTGILSAVGAMAGSMALGFARQYVSSQLKNALKSRE